MAQKYCPQCKRLIDSGVMSCPHCKKIFGTMFIAKIIIGIVGIGLLLGFLSTFFDNANKNSIQPVNKPKTNFDAMTSAQHLALAKKALLLDYKPNKDITKALFGHIDDARKHIEAINSSATEYTEARSLMPEVVRREKEMNKASKITAERMPIELRKEFAKKYEHSLLDKGMDVHVSTLGKDNTTLKIQWVLVSRPLVHKMANDPDFVSDLSKSGFKKVIMSDGYDQSWSMDIK